jgi:hypothetical protein
MKLSPHTIPLHPTRTIKQQHSFTQEPEDRALHRNKYRNSISRGNHTSYMREQSRLRSKEIFDLNAFEKKGFKF